MNQTIALANPLPEFPAVKVEHNDQSTTLTYRPPWWARLFAYAFFGIWLSGWSIMCLALLAGLVTDFSWFGLMACLPFLVGWFFGAGMFLYMTTGKQVIRIGHETVEVTNSILLGNTLAKKVKRQDVLRVRIVCDDGSYNCALETSSGSIQLYISSTKKQHIEKAVVFLQLQLNRLPVDSVATDISTSSKTTDELAPSKSSFQLRRTPQHPKESRWNNEIGFAGKTVFSQSGKFNFLESLTLTGVCLFWNSIVTVFLLSPFSDFGNQANPPQGAGLVFLYVFMTPFAIIGLVLVAVALGSIFAPLLKTTFTFSNREIVRTDHYFGIPFSQTWLATDSLQIFLRHRQQDREKQFFQPDGQDKEPNQFSLEFHNAEKRITYLRDLTYDEASWMSTVIVDHLRNFHSEDLG